MSKKKDVILSSAASCPQFFLSLQAEGCGRDSQFRHHASLSWLCGLRTSIWSHLDNQIKIRSWETHYHLMSVKTRPVKEAVFLLFFSITALWNCQLKDVNIMCGLAILFQSSNPCSESLPSFLQVGFPPPDPCWTSKISPGENFIE